MTKAKPNLHRILQAAALIASSDAGNLSKDDVEAFAMKFLGGYKTREIEAALKVVRVAEAMFDA